jgi:hypothetical protein
MYPLILAHLSCILLVGGLRFGPGAVLPGAGQALWATITVVASILMTASLIAEARKGRAPWSAPGRIVLWLVFPGAAALAWGLGGVDAGTGAEAPVLGLIFGLVLALLFCRRGEWVGRETDRRAWITGVRWVLAPTTTVLVTGALIGFDRAGTVPAMLTYPLYALGQLLAALVLPWSQWARDGLGRRQRVIGIALLFALVHWPNLFAVSVTLVGMLLWASAWSAGSALLPLAMSMGLMATAVTQALPDDLTGHMRIAANAVTQGRAQSRDRELDARAQRISVESGWMDAEGLHPWLERALPLTTGAPVDSALVSGTCDLLVRLHREQLLRWIFDSDEFRRRHGIENRLRTTELRFFESTFAPFHPAHAAYAGLVARGSSLDHRGFVGLAYPELLGREPVEAEFLHWPEPLTVGTRIEFIRRVLEGDGVGGADLRRWREPEDPELRRELREIPGATRR